MQNLPVTIVIPVRNEAPTLHELFSSLVALSPKPAEVIFVDTGSNDGSVESITRWMECAKSENIQCCLFRQPGAYPGAARNVGVKAASQPWIAFLDAGIVPQRDWLGMLLACSNKWNAIAVYGVCRFRSSDPFGQMICAISYGMGAVAPVLPASLFHKEVFDCAGYFEEGLRSGEDIRWKRSLDAAGVSIKVCDEAVVDYAHFPPNLSSALMKWFVYEQSAAIARVGGLRRVFILFSIAMLYGLAVFGGKWGAILLVAYLLVRGGVDPFRRSVANRWWTYWWQPLAVIPIVAMLDLASIAGRSIAIFGMSRFRLASHSGESQGRQGAGRLCFVVSSPMSAVAFLIPHIKALRENFEISLAANSQDTNLLRQYGVDLSILPVPIERAVRPWRDLIALFSLYRLFRQQHFDIVHSLTPKAGLLTMCAAWLARVPVRVHWFTGQVWATKSGMGRGILKIADWLTATLATRVLVDSPSQRDFLLAENVISERHAEVLADGSVCGVDGERFCPSIEARRAVRGELGIPDDAVLILYLGRLNSDKGIGDLAASFANLAISRPNLWLLLVGPDEEGMQVQVRATCRECLDRVRFVGFTDKPEQFMAAADLFCLPSYREGFGSSVIEAAACGVPAVVSRIYGLTDAVLEGETGFLHPPGDVPAMISEIDRLIVNDGLRKSMGEAARKRVSQSFGQGRLTEALRDFYMKVLA